MTNALLILHPRAHQNPLLPQLVSHFASVYDLTVRTSEYAGHTSAICQAALANAFSGPILCGGGDGTFHEAVNAWAELGFPSGPRFAPLPLGTGNDFLYSIAAEFRHLQTFLERPLSWSGQVDLGRVTYHSPEGPRHRHFCVGATAGFSALVTFRRARLAQRVPGHLSYLLALFLSLGSWRNTPCRIQHGAESTEHPVFFNLNAANVRHYGGGMVSAPLADPFAGHLDGVAMNLTIPEVIRALPQNFRGRFDLVKNVHQFPIREPLTLTTERVCLVQADGEPLGETPMTVDCLPGRLPVLLPGSSSMQAVD